MCLNKNNQKMIQGMVDYHKNKKYSDADND